MNIFHNFIFLARSFHSFINSSETDSATRRQFSKFLSCFQSSWSFVNCNRLLGKINPQKLWEKKFYHNFRIQSFHPPLPRKAEIENLRYWAQFTRASRSRKSMKNGSVLFFFKTLADDVNFWNTWMLTKKWF